jgi:hypothetical protein
MNASIEELQEALRYIIDTTQGQEIVDDIRPLAEMLGLEIDTVPQVKVHWTGIREVEMEVVTRAETIKQFLRENWESSDEPYWETVTVNDQVQTLTVPVEVGGCMNVDMVEVAAAGGLGQAVEARLNGFVAVESVTVDRRSTRYTVKSGEPQPAA